jgi:hypothetical protein
MKGLIKMNLSQHEVQAIQNQARNLSKYARRAFQVKHSIKYCRSSPRYTEYIFGWSRRSIKKGFIELETGIIHEPIKNNGQIRWEVKHPELYDCLKQLFIERRGSLKKIIRLFELKVGSENVPSLKTIINVLARNNLRSIRPKYLDYQLINQEINIIAGAYKANNETFNSLHILNELRRRKQITYLPSRSVICKLLIENGYKTKQVKVYE